MRLRVAWNPGRPVYFPMSEVLLHIADIILSDTKPPEIRGFVTKNIESFAWWAAYPPSGISVVAAAAVGERCLRTKRNEKGNPEHYGRASGVEQPGSSLASY